MDRTKILVPDFIKKKQSSEKIVMLTAFDATIARLLDQAGIDALLVGDSLGMVALGHETTLPVTMEEMIHYTLAVSRGAQHALVIADMPFLSYQIGVDDAVKNAGLMLKHGGASAVKIEGGRSVIEVVTRFVEVGIPVMGHLGVLPQSVHKTGGYAKRGIIPEEADQIMKDAMALEEAGAFSIVLEAIPDGLAAAVTQEIKIPTIGIGAGPGCDGQVLVTSDMLGLLERVPSFVKEYARLGPEIVKAVQLYVDEVHIGVFPAAIDQK